MFNPRQLLAQVQCVETFRKCVDEDIAANRLDDCRKAAWAYIALAMDKLINRNSILTRWDSGKDIVVGTFDSHDFGFKWSYGEMAVACQGLGLEWSLGDMNDCLSELLEMTNQGETPSQFLTQEDKARVSTPSDIINSEAQFIPQLDDDSIDCIVFDPPYDDNVCYAELSDFFYIWLKRTAGYIFQEDFSRHLTEKDLEAIASPARFKEGKTKTKSRGKAGNR